MSTLGPLLDIVKGINLDDVIYEQRFVNFTPFMPGDFETKSWDVLNVKVENGYVRAELSPSRPHLAPSLIGRLRWALRALLANYVKDPKTFKDVEKAFTTKNGLSLIDFTFGRVGDPSWAALYKVLVKYDPEPSPWPLGLCCAYLNSGVLNKSAKSKYKDLNYLKNRYCSLLSRSSLKGAEAKLRAALSKLPVAKAEIEVKVIRDPRVSNEMLDDFEEVLKSLVDFVLFSLGLGKATSRGFGRFVARGKEADSNTFEELRNEVSRKLEDFVGKHYGYERVKGEPKVPVLDLESYEVLDVKVRKDFRGCNEILKKFMLNVKPSKISKVDELIEAIGEAVTKNAWKRAANIDFKEPGPGFHTWPLGLPRWQQKTGYALSSEKRDEGRGLLKGTNEGRRQSMIYLFPTIDSKAVMLKMLTYDMFDLVKGKDGERLFHQGKHGSTYHFASVKHIMTKECLDSIPDPAGIITFEEDSCDQRVDSEAKLKELYNVALEASVDWVKAVLERRSCDGNAIVSKCKGLTPSKHYKHGGHHKGRRRKGYGKYT